MMLIEKEKEREILDAKKAIWELIAFLWTGFCQ